MKKSVPALPRRSLDGVVRYLRFVAFIVSASVMAVSSYGDHIRQLFRMSTDVVWCERSAVGDFPARPQTRAVTGGWK